MPLTVEEYLTRGLRRDDLAWDYQREFISIVNASGMEIRDDPARASVMTYSRLKGSQNKNLTKSRGKTTAD